jgi:hypothetical protein
VSLVLTPATKATIDALSQRAHQQPFTTPHMRRLFSQPKPERTIVVPHGYLVVFTVAHFRPQWIGRLLSVTGPEKWPDPSAVKTLMRLFGFHNELEHCLTWPDGVTARTAVNVFEPIDNNWAPLRSS